MAALSGILLAPSVNLEAMVLTLPVVQAFGAATIGLLESSADLRRSPDHGRPGGRFRQYVTQNPSLTGLPPSLPFIILFIALIFTPRGRLANRRFVPSKSWSVISEAAATVGPRQRQWQPGWWITMQAAVEIATGWFGFGS